MKKIIKSIVIVVLGLILWSGLVLLGIAFVRAEMNPFCWSSEARGLMLFIVFIYITFSPLLFLQVLDELNKEK